MERQLHVHSHPSHVEHWRHLVEIVALIVAAAWGFYVFVYQERIKPAEAPVTLQVTPLVTHETLPNGRLLVHVMVSMKNIGTSEVQLAGTVENVYGIRFGSQMRHNAMHRANGTSNVDTYSLPMSRPVLLATALNVYTPWGGKTSSLFSPDREKKFGVTFAVPQNAFDAVTVEIGECALRSDDKQTFTNRATRTADGAFDSNMFMRFQRDVPSATCVAGNAGTAAL